MTGIRKPSVRLVSAAVAFTLAALTAQEPQVAAERLLYDGQKRIGLPIPSDWKITNRVTRDVAMKSGAVTVAFEFTANSPALGEIEVIIWLLNGCRPSDRLQAVFERAGKVEKGHAYEDKYELAMEPVPHAVYRLKESPDHTHLIVHRRAHGRSMSVSFEIPNGMVAKARSTLVAIGSKAVVDLPLWPPREPGYDYVAESGFEIAFADEFDKKDRKAVRRFVKDTVKAFRKLHGEPLFVASEPVVIYVDRDKRKKAKLLWSDQDEIDIDDDVGIRRIATTVPYDPDTREELAACLYRYLLFSVYPQTDTMWLHWGEVALGRMQASCGKSLPTVPKSWLRNVKRVRLGLDEVIAKPRGVNYADAAAWVAFFRLGPGKYRKAYQQLLAELRTGADPSGAVAKLRQTFDLKKVRAQARKTLEAKLKPAKSK